MKKRILSMLLAICLIVGLLPAGTASAANYERWGSIIRVGWDDADGGWAWESFVDYDDPTLPRTQSGTPPEGVTFDEDTNTLTLSGASVNIIEIQHWGDNPLKIVIDGENTVTGESSLGHAAFNIDGCSNVTISGAIGKTVDKLTLNSDVNQALRFSSYVPYSEDENGAPEMINEGGITVENLTLEAISDFSGDNFNIDEGWNWTAVNINGGATFSNVDLTTEGYYGIDTWGSIVFENSTVTTPTLSFAALEKRPGNSEDVFETASRITNSDIEIIPNTGDIYEHRVLLGVHLGASLTLESGSVSIDATDASPRLMPMELAHTDGARVSSFTMNGGTLDIKLQPAEKAYGVVEGSTAISVGYGATWTQTGGDVSVTIDAGMKPEDVVHETHTVTVEGGASLNLNGGSFTIDNINDEEIVGAAGVMGISAWTESGLNFTGGTLNVTGTADRPYDVPVWVYNEMIVTGDAVLNLKGLIQTDSQQSHIQIYGGTININSAVESLNIGSALSVYGGTINAVSPAGCEGIYARQGYIRFLGGEVNVTAGSALTWQTSENQVTFGDGVKAAYPDGTEATVKELYWEDYFLGWATNTNYIYEEFADETETVVIKKQGVKADVAESSLVLELTNTTALVAGVPINFRVIPTLASTGETLTVTLPLSLDLNGVTVNNVKVDPTITGSGFTIAVTNGDIVRFSATPGAVGKVSVTASAGGASQTLKLDIEDYTLSMPTTINQPKFVIFGTAAAGSEIWFYEKKDNVTKSIGNADVSASGTWKATLTVMSEEGVDSSSHNIYAEIKKDGGTLATTETYTVFYSDVSVAVETLTITNTIHGATSADPNKEVSVTLDYTNGTRTQNYYIYWPDLPEFRFDVKFSASGTPQHISEVKVIATDRKGVEQEVPLKYDETTGLWSGTQDFCDGVNIVPEMFRVSWLPVGEVEGDTTEDVEVPPSIAPEPQYDKDFSTGAIAFTEAGEFSVNVASGAVIEGVYDINDDAEVYSVTNDVCTFTVEEGEFYTVRLLEGEFADPYAGYDTLYVIGKGGSDTPTVTYLDNVKQVKSTAFSSFDAEGMTFTSDSVYAKGDILLIDEASAVVVTEADGTNYTFRDANIDEVYATLDISDAAMITDELMWENDEEALAEQFMASEFFASYVDSVEETFERAFANAASDSEEDDDGGTITIGPDGVSYEKEFEIEDHKVEVKAAASVTTDGVVTIRPEIVVTTKAKTKLPLVGEQETTIVTTFFNELMQDYDFRVRFNTEINKHSVYYAVTETHTQGMDINISIGEKEDEGGSGAGGGIVKYFEEMAGEIKANFLEGLEGKQDKEAKLTFAKIAIPTPIPSIVIYAEPSFELNWGFFGEVTLGAQLINEHKAGFAVTYTNGDWNTAIFAKREMPRLTANATLHLSSFVEATLRVDAGVSVLRIFDLGLYAQAGPKLVFNGHGTAGFDSAADSKLGADAELFVRLSLEAEAGAHIGLKFAKIKLLDRDFPIFEMSKTLSEFGWDTMPLQFNTVEGPDPLLKPGEYKIVERIDVAIAQQTFNGSAPSVKVYDENNYERYTFTVEYGDVSIVGEGEYATVKVNDLYNECSYGIRITFESNEYTLYKVVPLLYKPGNIDVYVSAEEVPPIAPIEIVEIGGLHRTFGGATDSNGFWTVNVGEGEFMVSQLSPPAKNMLVSQSPVGPVKVQLGNDGSASFDNEAIDEMESPDFPLPASGDPSGYVYEGIESNRLEGVTTTLYYKPTAETPDSEAEKWDAAPFDQSNPLYTDSLGQYLWMVPTGWWQVEYKLDGYKTETSEWMEVPPIRTGVNQNLTSDEPATMTVEYSEYDGNILLRFDRPVITSTLTTSTLTNVAITIDGVKYEGGYEISPVDADWSVTKDPADSALCATTFRLYIYDDVMGRSIEVSLNGVETYFGTSSDVSDGETMPKYYTIIFDPANGEDKISLRTDANGVLADLPDEPTRDNYNFGGWYTENGTKVEAGMTFSAHTEVTAKWNAKSNGNVTVPSGTTARTYEIAVAETENGAVSITPEKAEQGETVTITVTPDDGYILDTLTVTDADGNELELTKNEDGTYSFVSTGKGVTVTATFAVEPCDGGEDCPSAAFSDIDTAMWYHEAIDYVIKNGLMIGTGNGKFSPMGTMNRAMVVVVLHRLAGEPAPSGDNPFTDVPDGTWYTDAVIWAAENGIVEGHGNGTFTPLDDVTREQLATMLYRYEQFAGGDVTSGENTNILSFDDAFEISDWAYPALQWAVAEGIFEGDDEGLLDPRGNALRCHFAKILMVYLERE